MALWSKLHPLPEKIYWMAGYSTLTSSPSLLGGGMLGHWGGRMVSRLPDDLGCHGWRRSAQVTDAGGSGCGKAFGEKQVKAWVN